MAAEHGSPGDEGVRPARGSRRRTIGLVAVIVALVAAFGVFVFGRGNPPAGTSTAPTAWTLPALRGGGSVRLADFRGRPTVVDFFASWCTACDSELPGFADVSAKLKGVVDFVGVNSLETGDPNSMPTRHDITWWPLARDVGGANGSGLHDALGGGSSMPVTAFYDATGRLLRVERSALPEDALKQELSQLYGIAADGSSSPGGQAAAAGAGTGTGAHSCGHDLNFHIPGIAGPPDDPLVVLLGVNDIPAITQPRFESVQNALAWLPSDAPVITVVQGGDVRAYPLAILEWHEVVDDTIGGRPVAITYCPLCNSAIVYDRRDGTRQRTLETSGALDNGALVLIDPATRQMWLQPSGASLYQGSALTWVPSGMMSLRDAIRAYPNLVVLSRNTGFDRDYSASPYGDVGGPGIATGFRGYYDERIPPKTRVSGVVVGGRARAWQYPALAQQQAIDDAVASTPVVVFYDQAVTGIGNSANLLAAPEVGASAVYRRSVNGRVLTFTAIDSAQFRDNETGSIWDFTGRAVQGPMTGNQLVPIRHLDTYWYAWAAFYPGTSLFPAAPACTP